MVGLRSQVIVPLPADVGLSPRYRPQVISVDETPAPSRLRRVRADAPVPIENDSLSSFRFFSLSCVSAQKLISFSANRFALLPKPVSPTRF
jgi:hypothetical protein